MRTLRNLTLSFIVMPLFSISFISCLFSLGNFDKKTGIVSGSLRNSATIALRQADGTTRTCHTSQENPTYIFKEVPVGESKIDITTNSSETSQVIQVNADKTTRVYPFGSSQQMRNSLLASVYEAENKGWDTTTENITENPIGEEFYSREINVPHRIFTEGFPGVTDRFEWFGVIYEGKIVAPETGEYNFRITCDDGAVLTIDDEEVVVDGDGVHPPTVFTGSINLTRGEVHDFMLEYFQGPAMEIQLVVEVQIPGRDMQLFNMNDWIN